MRRVARHLFTILSALSLLLFLGLVAFLLGKTIGPDDEGNSNGLYWLHWRVDGLWWLSAGRVLNLDLEAVLMVCTLAMPVAWLFNRLRFVCHRDVNLCPTCGYDLRAHAAGDRCPECGMVPASGTQGGIT